MINVLSDVGALWTYPNLIRLWNVAFTEWDQGKRVDKLSNAFTTLPLDSSINKFRRGCKNKLTKHRWCKISIKLPSSQSLSFIDIYTKTIRKTVLTEQSICYSRRVFVIVVDFRYNCDGAQVWCSCVQYNVNFEILRCRPGYDRFQIWMMFLLYYRTWVRSLAMLVINWLTDTVTFSRLDWCDPGVWRCLLKTCWGCYCCWC